MVWYTSRDEWRDVLVSNGYSLQWCDNFSKAADLFKTDTVVQSLLWLTDIIAPLV